ncbi:hypothetical protein [Streptomyces sp. NPDC048516]|uniref:hypothetical protein n=1 Tax=Streptomyces sp. NPDC048516 TaxID=3365565 RepID=UPI003721AFAC
MGIGCVFGPMVTVAMYRVEPTMAGAASGVLNALRQIGTVIGSAAVGAVLQNRLAASLRGEAAKRASDLPAGVRNPFLEGLRHAAESGQEAGVGQSGAMVHLPQGTPSGLAHRVQMAASTLEHGVVHAMRPTLALPIIVIAVGALACFLVRRRQVAGPHPATKSADLSASS